MNETDHKRINALQDRYRPCDDSIKYIRAHLEAGLTWAQIWEKMDEERRYWRAWAAEIITSNGNDCYCKQCREKYKRNFPTIEQVLAKLDE